MTFQEQAKRIPNWAWIILFYLVIGVLVEAYLKYANAPKGVSFRPSPTFVLTWPVQVFFPSAVSSTTTTGGAGAGVYQEIFGKGA